jgi:hypothetical protein
MRRENSYQKLHILRIPPYTTSERHIRWRTANPHPISSLVHRIGVQISGNEEQEIMFA